MYAQSVSKSGVYYSGNNTFSYRKKVIAILILNHNINHNINHNNNHNINHNNNHNINHALSIGLIDAWYSSKTDSHKELAALSHETPLIPRDSENIRRDSGNRKAALIRRS
jgi:hypothetical protein